MHFQATPADFPDLVCVNQKFLLNYTGSALKEIWSCKLSSSDKCRGEFSGSVWSRDSFLVFETELAMPFVGSSSFSAPSINDVFSLDASKVTVITPPAPKVLPMQVHLALGHTPTSMAVAWATYEKNKTGSTHSE